MYPFCVDQQSN